MCEDGTGHWLYPTVRRYLSWCEVVATEALDIEWNASEERYVCEGEVS